MRIKDYTDTIRHLTDPFNIPEARRMIQENPALTQEQFKAGGIVEPGVAHYGRPELSRRGTPKVKSALLRSPLLKDKQKAWKDMNEFYKKFIKKHGRVPNKKEFAKFSGYGQRALDTAEQTRGIKFLGGPTKEVATAGAYKRGEVIRAKPVEQPVITRLGPVEKQVKAGIRWPNEKVKKEVLDNLRLRYKYPRLSAEGKAAGVLSNAELHAKYFKPTTAYATVKEVLMEAAKEAKIKPDYPSVMGDVAEKDRTYHLRRRKILKEISDPAYEKKIKGTQNTHLHHMQSKRFNVSTRTLGYAPPKMNIDKLLSFEKRLDSLYIQREKLLKDKPKDLIKKLEDINVKGMNIVADPKVKGHLNFKIMDPKTLKISDHGVNLTKTIDPLDLLKGKAIKDLTQADKDLIELNRAAIMKRETGPRAFPKIKKTALSELMQRQGALMDPVLAGRAVTEETGGLLKGAATKFPKTTAVLKSIFETRSTPGAVFWAAEAPLLMLQGTYDRYANERDFKKALKRMELPDQVINQLGEVYGQELADIGQVGLESWAVDQPDTFETRKMLTEQMAEKKPHFETRQAGPLMLKDFGQITQSEREMQDYEEQLKQQEIEKRTREAYEKYQGRRGRREGGIMGLKK